MVKTERRQKMAKINEEIGALNVLLNEIAEKSENGGLRFAEMQQHLAHTVLPMLPKDEELSDTIAASYLMLIKDWIQRLTALEQPPSGIWPRRGSMARAADNSPLRFIGKQSGKQSSATSNGNLSKQSNVSARVESSESSGQTAKLDSDAGRMPGTRSVCSGSMQDIAGLKYAKQTLTEAILFPVLYPNLFGPHRRPWRCILLYGPPGTGKSRLASLVAGEIPNCEFYEVSSADLLSSWMGESEKLVRDLFSQCLNRTHPIVVFIDELDSLCRQRNSREQEGSRRVKTELLVQMQKVQDSDSSKAFVICATNCPWELDSAFIRRFQKRIYIGLPDKEARIEIMRNSSKCFLSEKEWLLLGDATEGLSGSDLIQLCQEVSYEPLRELNTTQFWRRDMSGYYAPCSASTVGAMKALPGRLPFAQLKPRNLTAEDFNVSLKKVSRTVTTEELQRFEEFTKNLGICG